ncbi:MAG: DNA repair protein RecN [Deltaproteobacteria bacterium]|nr:DNA repair protein RecN [Deltaproteobacteria bacterium]
MIASQTGSFRYVKPGLKNSSGKLSSMLTAIEISNFAIIEHQTIGFSPGLNVISGETGAGKSIILSALEIILGGKPKVSSIRAAADQLEVQAHFDLGVLPAQIKNELPDSVRGDELLISRSFNRHGKGRVYFNGRLASAALLEEVSGKLVNICRQGQQMLLLEPRYHRELIDDFGTPSDLLSEMSEAMRSCRELQELFDKAAALKRDFVRRQNEINEIISDLQPLSLRAGLRAELETSIRRLEGSERLVENLQQALALLEGEQGILTQLSLCQPRFLQAARLDPDAASFSERAASLKTEADDLAHSISEHLYKIDIDQQSLSELRDRLANVARMERKYRCADDELLQVLVGAEREMTVAPELDAGKLEGQLSAARVRAEELARRLSTVRRESAERLVKAIEADLAELNMPDVRLSVAIEKAELNSTGCDRIEFLISTNKGEPYKALKHVASGGELSRVMLALKKNLRDRSNVNVLVFDEVDSGVSGKVARAMGRKLRELAQNSQVICITHLAQIASLADHHLLVDKKVGERTVSIVREIQGKEKVEEIARMLAGYKVTKAARESAKELLASKN